MNKNIIAGLKQDSKIEADKIMNNQKEIFRNKVIVFLSKEPALASNILDIRDFIENAKSSIPVFTSNYSFRQKVVLLRMKIIIPFLLFFLFMNTAQSQDLSEHHWENRLILLLTENLTDENFTNQLKELETGLKDLEERNVIVYQVFQHKMKLGLAKDTEWTTATNLYKKYDEKNSPFEFYLIGLDGEIKLQDYNCISIDKILDLIDSMLMRKNEIRSKT